MAKNRRSVPFAFTPISNHFIEHQMGTLRESELKVYLTIMRFTWGHGKRKDSIATVQLIKMTTLPRSTVCLAVKGLREGGFIEVTGPSRRPRIFEVLMPKNFKSVVQPIRLPSPARSPAG